MFEFLNQHRNQLLKIFSLILVITLVTNLININFEVDNYRLTRSIDTIEEDKNILRAQYLSDTSMSTLDYKASALKMSEISRENSFKISKNSEALKFKALKDNHLESRNEIASTNGVNRYFSGF